MNSLWSIIFLMYFSVGQIRKQKLSYIWFFMNQSKVKQAWFYSPSHQRKSGMTPVKAVELHQCKTSGWEESGPRRITTVQNQYEWETNQVHCVFEPLAALPQFFTFLQKWKLQARVVCSLNVENFALGKTVEHFCFPQSRILPYFSYKKWIMERNDKICLSNLPKNKQTKSVFIRIFFLSKCKMIVQHSFVCCPYTPGSALI